MGMSVLAIFHLSLLPNSSLETIPLYSLLNINMNDVHCFYLRTILQIVQILDDNYIAAAVKIKKIV